MTGDKHDNGGEFGGLVSPAELRAELRSAEGRPASSAIAMTRDHKAIIVVAYDKLPRKAATALKTRCRAAGIELDPTTVRFGRVSWSSGGPVAIIVNRPVPPGMEQKLKPVMRAAGHPHFTIDADPALEDEPEDAADEPGADKASPTPPASPPTALAVALRDVAQSIPAAVAANPSRRQPLATLLKDALERVKAGDSQAATASIQALRRALASTL